MFCQLKINCFISFGNFVSVFIIYVDDISVYDENFMSDVYFLNM